MTNPKLFYLVMNQRVHLRNLHQLSLQNFKEDFVSSHIQTSSLQKYLLTVGASLVSLLDPSRGDMIATLGETSGQRALPFMKRKLEETEEGRAILRDMPRINSKTVDLTFLRKLPQDTVGYTYYKFLEKNKVTPDSRLTVQFVDDLELAYVMQRYREVHDLIHAILGMPTNMLVTPDSRLTVQFVDDLELAYVMQRYREVHDLIHAILGMPTNMLGEVTVKWVEGIQTRLPMCIGGGLLGAIRLSPKQRQKYVRTHLPWAVQTGMSSKFLLGVYFERRWEQPLPELHKELNITPLSS